MSTPAHVAYCLTAPGGYWQCVRTMAEVEVLRDGHAERTVRSLVAFTDSRGALVHLREQLRAEHAAQMAEAEAMIAALVAELARLKS